MTSDPEGGSDGLPPSPYGPPYGPSHGPVPYGPAPYGPPAYGRPGYGPPSYGPLPYAPGYFQPAMRAAAADRERTLDVLRAAYTEGRLAKEEFETRSAQVMRAQTYGDLTRIVADLPAGPAGPPVLYPPGYYPVPRSPTNGLAAGSLVCALMGLLMPLLLIPAVVMGHVARDQIRTRHQRGDGLAIAGLVFGYLGTAFWALIIVIAATRG